MNERELKYRLKQANKLMGKQGQTIYQLRNEVAALRLKLAGARWEAAEAKQKVMDMSEDVFGLPGYGLVDAPEGSRWEPVETPPAEVVEHNGITNVLHAEYVAPSVVTGLL